MKNKRKFQEIADEFINFIKDKKLIIHNARFDLSHLNNELKLVGKKPITEDQVIEIGTDEYIDSDLFSKREKAALLWATHVTLNTAKKDNGVYEQVRKEFDEQ